MENIIIIAVFTIAFSVAEIYINSKPGKYNKNNKRNH